MATCSCTPFPQPAGTPIGANELWIGCHALAESATLVSTNEREFRRLVGLAVENWTAA
jgi:tRNA(fMet)-specific endonuclease VapC